MNEKGFTLLEVLLAISLSTVLLLSASYFSIDGIAGSNQAYNQTLVLANARTAVSIVAGVVRSAVSVEANNSQPDTNAPGAPGNLYSWSGSGGSGATLILAVPSRDSNGNIIYIDSLHTQLYADDVIYYLDSSTHKLYRRYIANSTAPGNAAVTTCPPSKATPSCPSDADVVDDVANLTTSYLDGNGNIVTLPSGTEAVNYTITETKTINGKTISGTYSTVASLRNK
jgi:prepilin-type N-terminal cleavage/methylation domain-containing protein